jgi:predicted  nucleic acid-binding Zn ribbon protein
MLEATVEAPSNGEVYGATEGESCPECNHVWFLDAPAHFTDCRYFSLDDDRDE